MQSLGKIRKRAKRVVDLWREENKIKGELDYFNKCEVGISAKFMSACVHARPHDYLDVLVLHRACEPCSHGHIVHA